MSLIKEAEQNIVNICKTFDDILQILDALSSIGNNYTKEHIAKKDFFVGLDKIRRAINAEHANAVRDCFTFVGVGGKDANAYSKQKFKEVFRDQDQQMILHFLDKHGRRPASWNTTKDRSFRDEAKKLIKLQN